MAGADAPPAGDFLDLLRRQAHPFAAGRQPGARVVEQAHPLVEAHGTTVIAVKYEGGVLNVGDRRATSANAVMYDRAEKILSVDDSTLLALSGSYARALEVVRYLRHAFHYYRRTQLQEMSLEGKMAEVSRVIAQNVASAMSGIGAFIPVLSVYDHGRVGRVPPDAGEGRIFFYDGLGARFESDEWGAAGSGSERIRGAFDYILKTKGPFRRMSLEDALTQALVLLDIAAEMDAATGGYDKVLPCAKAVSAVGVEVLSEERLRASVQRIRRS